MKTRVTIHFGDDAVPLGEWPLPEYLRHANLWHTKQLSVLYHALLNGLSCDRYAFAISAVEQGATVTVGDHAPSSLGGTRPVAEPETAVLADRSEGRN